MSIDLSLQGDIAVVTLNRPDALNAIDAAMRRELQDTWRHLGAMPTLRAIIVTGAGERAFCAGADLKGAPAPDTSFAQETFGLNHNGSLLDGLQTDTPMICAFNGLAFGGGLEIGLACDIRIAADHARFALPEARVGTLPGSGGTQHLPRLIGRSDAMLMLLAGETFDAQEAWRIGLVSKVVPAAELQSCAMTIAQRICANAPLAVRAIKRLVREGMDMPLATALTHERQAWGLLRDTEDRREGRVAFAEKRAPIYRGR